jgi:hypothetical protein
MNEEQRLEKYTEMTPSPEVEKAIENICIEADRIDEIGTTGIYGVSLTATEMDRVTLISQSPVEPFEHNEQVYVDPGPLVVETPPLTKLEQQIVTKLSGQMKSELMLASLLEIGLNYNPASRLSKIEHAKLRAKRKVERQRRKINQRKK